MNSTIGGVGILLSPKALMSLNSFEKISPRIVIVSFSGNPQTTVICCYSPTNVSDEEEVVRFYDELASLTRAVPKHNILVVAVDLNAKVEKLHTVTLSIQQPTGMENTLINIFFLISFIV